MSQEPETTLITARKQRTRRRGARPVLVNNPETERVTGELATPSLQDDPQTEPLAEDSVAVAVAEAKPARPARLPRFFSKVAKEETETTAPDEEIAKARLARATKGKNQAAATKSEGNEDAARESSKPKAASKPAAPPRMFKTRHFLGMGIYLIGAQFVLPLELTLARNLGLEKTLATLPLFGQKLPIDTSLFLNIATLIILLYALVKLDLLPSTLTARNVAEQRARERAKQTQKESAEKSAQPTIRQGVKGVDDDLYQAYRQGQRREKKR